MVVSEKCKTTYMMIVPDRESNFAGLETVTRENDSTGSVRPHSGRPHTVYITANINKVRDAYLAH